MRNDDELCIPIQPVIDLLEEAVPWRTGGVVRIATLLSRVEAARIFPVALPLRGRRNLVIRAIESAVLQARGIPVPSHCCVDRTTGELTTPRHPGAPPVNDTILIPHPEWRKRDRQVSR